MSNKAPHPIPYQGSKRNLAPAICTLFPNSVDTLFEPFAGSAAITIFAARHKLARRFIIGDCLPSLIKLWQQIVNEPEAAARKYERIWNGQVEGAPDYYNGIRERFNREGDPIDLLYLTARCVKNAVRFNKFGKFTQSVDRRRLGMRPAKMREAIAGVSFLLKGKTEFFCGDFKDALSAATNRDLVYMDPPYQGTTYGRDKRYFAQLEREHLIEELAGLNIRRVPFLLSYDGMSGNVVYGEALPEHLEMRRFLMNAGRSSQATLNGRDDVTVESLYVSKFISGKAEITVHDQQSPQQSLFAA